MSILEEENINLYELFGLPNGPESTASEIKKAYRKKALESHPDKRPGDKNAAAEFDRIKKAYEILGDEAAKSAYDSLLKVRREREQRATTQSAKRQKMVADLLAREKVAEKEKSEMESARSKLKAEIERLRKRAAESKQPNVNGCVVQPVNLSKERLQELSRTLKVTWSKVGGDDYSVQTLRDIFGVFGVVEDLIIRSGKKKNKGSALVILSSKEAAIAATRAVCGSISNPLLVVPAAPEGETGESSSAPSSYGPQVQIGKAPPIGSTFQDFERATLLRMKQAAERARIIKEMQEQDKQENDKNDQ